MVERTIEEGFVDCPRFGVIDEMRCLPSCEWFEGKNEARIACRFGEPWPAAPAEHEAEPIADQA